MQPPYMNPPLAAPYNYQHPPAATTIFFCFVNIAIFFLTGIIMSCIIMCKICFYLISTLCVT